MPKKKGPPYPLDDLDCKYIVVENPWPAGYRGPIGPARTDMFYQSVGAWLRYALNKEKYPETIYSRNTRAELIVKFSKDVDIKPLLGAHHWPYFHKGVVSSQDISYVFEFNYARNGDPENHDWAIHELDACDPPHWGASTPFKQPYPSPTWADIRQPMISCRDLALAMPVPQEDLFPVPEVAAQPKPGANAGESAPPQIEQSSVYSFANGMKERGPKVEENAEGLRSQSRGTSAGQQPEQKSRQNDTRNSDQNPRHNSSAASMPIASHSGSKSDPYEQDTALAQMLRAGPTDIGLSAKAPSNVKVEAQGPSPELIAAFDQFQRSKQGSPAGSNAVKVESEGPSPELMAAMNAYNQSLNRPTPVIKPESSEDALSPSPSNYSRYDTGRSTREVVPPHRSSHTVKSEDSSSHSRFEPPPSHHRQDSYSGSYDPRRRNRPVKRESDGGWAPNAKRQRRDSRSWRD